MEVTGSIPVPPTISPEIGSDKMYALAASLVKPLARSLRSDGDPSRLLIRLPCSSSANGTCRYAGAGIFSARSRAICRGVLESRSAPRNGLRSHHEMVANYDVADPIPIIDRDRKAAEPTSNKSLPLT